MLNVQYVEDGVIGFWTGDPYSGLSAFSGWSYDLLEVAHMHTNINIM